jgi:hypothetical protein
MFIVFAHAYCDRPRCHFPPILPIIRFCSHRHSPSTLHINLPCAGTFLFNCAGANPLLLSLLHTPSLRSVVTVLDAMVNSRTYLAPTMKVISFAIPVDQN